MALIDLFSIRSSAQVKRGRCEEKPVPRLKFVREVLMAMSALSGDLGVFFVIYTSRTENLWLLSYAVLSFGAGAAINWCIGN